MERTLIGFAHRGGRHAGVSVNTLNAIRRSIAMGANGIESDVWLTDDGHAVLHHPRVPRPGVMRRRSRASLPESVPDLDAVYEVLGDEHLSLDMADPRAAGHAVSLARRHRATGRLWLTYWHLDVLARWHREWPDVHLVFPSLLLPWRRPVALLDRLAGAGVDALNLHIRQVRPAVVTACHDRNLRLFAWGVRDGAGARRAFDAGADAVFSDDVASLVAAVRDHTVEREARSRAARGGGR